MFDYGNLRVKIILVVIILSLATFLGGRYLFGQYRVEQPLINNIMEIEGVEEVVFNEQKAEIVLELEITEGFNIFTDYNKVESIAEEMLADSTFSIVINDKPDLQLEELLKEIHFPLFEGLSTHQYSEMKLQIEKIIAGYNIEDYQINIDDKNLYLQIRQGDHFIYRTFSRLLPLNNQKAGGENSG